MATPPVAESKYVFTQAAGGETERQRLEALARYRNPDTFRRLEAIGVGSGWSCLDVGAGGGSVSRWLCERVGPTGRVVATDLETEALERIDAPNLEIRRHDLLADTPPEGEFDLVHARYLLVHLPRREEALRRLIEAARPGGWIVIGDVDFRGMRPAEPNELFDRVWAALLAAFEEAGIHNTYGSALTERFERLGLLSVEAESVDRYTHGGSLPSELYGPTIEHTRRRMIDTGTVTDHEIDQMLAMLRDPEFAHWTSTHVTVSGRRPS